MATTKVRQWEQAVAGTRSSTDLDGGGAGNNLCVQLLKPIQRKQSKQWMVV